MEPLSRKLRTALGRVFYLKKAPVVRDWASEPADNIIWRCLRFIPVLNSELDYVTNFGSFARSFITLLYFTVNFVHSPRQLPRGGPERLKHGE